MKLFTHIPNFSILFAENRKSTWPSPSLILTNDLFETFTVSSGFNKKEKANV